MRLLLTGATGLVGQGVLQECLRAPDVEAVVVLGRHPTGLDDPRLAELQVDDFADLSAVEPRLHPFDACLYCAGTLPLGVSEAEFRHVTLDLTLAVAGTLARHNPRMTFVYVSGAGSDPAAVLMPLRVKGETERALQALPIRTLLLRPGVVQPVGEVHSPHRMREGLYALGGPLLALGVRLLPQAVTTTERVGRAMLAALRMEQPPAVLETADINRLGE